MLESQNTPPVCTGASSSSRPCATTRRRGGRQPQAALARRLHPPARRRHLQLSVPGAAIAAQDQRDRARGDGRDRRAGDFTCPRCTRPRSGRSPAAGTSMGDNMFRLKDRFGRELCLGMTHEEVMTTIARGELRSYRQLPQIWYQIQTKFRDEPRPKIGPAARAPVHHEGLLFLRYRCRRPGRLLREAPRRLLPDLRPLRPGIHRGGGALGRDGRQPVARVHGGVRRRRGFRRARTPNYAANLEKAVSDRETARRSRSRRRSDARRVPHARTSRPSPKWPSSRSARDLADQEPGDGRRRQAGPGAAARRSPAQRNQARRRTGGDGVRPAHPEEIGSGSARTPARWDRSASQNMRILADEALRGPPQHDRGRQQERLPSAPRHSRRRFPGRVPRSASGGRRRHVGGGRLAAYSAQDRRDRPHFQARLQVFEVHGPARDQRSQAKRSRPSWAATASASSGS